MDPKLLQGLALVAGVAIFSWVLLRRLATRPAARSARRGAGARDPEPWRSKGVVDGGQAFAGAQKLVLELEEFTRQLEARLDTKVHYLRKLIDEADRTADRLSGAIAEAEQGSTPAADPDPRRADAERLASQGLPTAEIAAQTGLPEGEIELILGLRGRRTS